MKFLSALVLLLAFNPVWACSCMSIGSIEESIDHLPILVEAQVISLEQVDTVYGRQTHSATLKVKRVLKGNVSSDAVTVEHWMCYASLDPDMMKVGHTYVLPLHTPNDNDRFGMAQCAHSGMELVDGKLYTLEETRSGGRQLKLHSKYSDFVRRLSAGSQVDGL
jgi:hypothetical protein